MNMNILKLLLSLVFSLSILGAHNWAVAFSFDTPMEVAVFGQCMVFLEMAKTTENGGEEISQKRRQLEIMAQNSAQTILQKNLMNHVYECFRPKFSELTGYQYDMCPVIAVPLTGPILAIGGTLSEKETLAKLGVPLSLVHINNILGEAKEIDIFGDVTHKRWPEIVKHEFSYAFARAVPLKWQALFANVFSSLTPDGTFLAYLIDFEQPPSEQEFCNEVTKFGFAFAEILPHKEDGCFMFVVSKKKTSSLEELIKDDPTLKILAGYVFGKDF